MTEEKKLGRPLTGKNALIKARTVYLTIDQDEAVMRLANSRGVAVASLIREAVEKQIMQAEMV